MVNDLITILMLLSILGVLYVTNTVFGAVIGTQKEKFSWDKIKKGMLKAFLFCLSFLAYCFCLEIMPVILLRIGIEVPSDIITIFEIVGITLTAYKKYVNDCYEKLQIILDIRKEV